MNNILISRWVTNAGLNACVLFVNDSHHCGYVTAPKELQDTHYDAVDCVVHGGITYSDYLAELDDEYVFGFDCAHYWNEENPCSFEDVKADCERLALALKNFRKD